MSKAEMYSEYLREEGYVPRVDDDGDVVFKKEGGTYILFADEEDKTYFRLVFPAFWEIESEDEDERARQAINELNADLKVIKLYVVRNNVWAGVEMFIDPIESFRATFPRSIRLLANAVNKFREKMTASG
jgi:hypothetical protein